MTVINFYQTERNNITEFTSAPLRIGTSKIIAKFRVKFKFKMFVPKSYKYITPEQYKTIETLAINAGME